MFFLKMHFIFYPTLRNSKKLKFSAAVMIDGIDGIGEHKVEHNPRGQLRGSCQMTITALYNISTQKFVHVVYG